MPFKTNKVVIIAESETRLPADRRTSHIIQCCPWRRKRPAGRHPRRSAYVEMGADGDAAHVDMERTWGTAYVSIMGRHYKRLRTESLGKAVASVRALLSHEKQSPWRKRTCVSALPRTQWEGVYSRTHATPCWKTLLSAGASHFTTTLACMAQKSCNSSLSFIAI